MSIQVLQSILQYSPRRRPPALALAAAHPLARLLTERTANGYAYGGVRIQGESFHDRVDPLYGRNIRTVFLPSEPVALERVLWWLHRFSTRHSIAVVCDERSVGMLSVFAQHLVSLRLMGSDLVPCAVHLPVLPEMLVLHMDLLLGSLTSSGAVASCLQNLREVHVARLSATSELNWLRYCPMLHSLTLENCSGSPQDFRSFHHIGALRRLSIKWAMISDVEWLCHHPHLTALTMYHCNVQSGDWSPIGKHERLTFVQLSGSNVSNLQWVQQCAHLENFSYNQCSHQFHDCAPIGSLRALTSLSLSYYGIRTGFLWTTGCRELEVLRLDWVSGPVDWDALAALHGLRVLHCTRCLVTSTVWMNSCPNVEEVHLDATSLHGGWSSLAVFSALRELRILRADVTLDRLDWLQCCTALEVLELTDCPSLRTLTNLNSLPKLKELYTNASTVDTWPIRLCQVLGWVSDTMSILANVFPLSGFHLCTTAGLSTLDLTRSTSIGDAAPLKNLTQLRIFHASRSTISSIQWLRGCAHSLQELHLHGCKRIRNWSPVSCALSLRVLIVSRNPQIPSLAWLSPLQALEQLDISESNASTEWSRLPPLPRLRLLRLSDNRENVRRWMWKCPSLEIVELRIWEKHIDDFITTQVLPQRDPVMVATAES